MTDATDASRVDPTGASSLGFRWPAEWEPHAATWLAWPHNEDTWPGCLARAEDAFVEIVRALFGQERVCIGVQDEAAEMHVRRRLGALESGCELYRLPTDDAWVRDHGPVFVHDRDGEVVALDFGFDAWGGKYPPWDRDAAIPEQVAKLRGVPVVAADFVLEGGSIDGNGEGTLLTTESCLLHPNREPGRTRSVMEARLARFLGAEHVVWLADGIEGDDTDGHIDDLARFVDTTTVVTALESTASDPNHAVLAENERRLRAAHDARGRRLDVVALPMPPPLSHQGSRCPASYVNFYLANGRALVPTFDAPSDARALAVLRELLPGREVVGVDARVLVVGLGAIHCLTQQEPAARSGAAGEGPRP